MGRSYYTALLPWLLFVFVARRGGQGLAWAAITALAAAIVIAGAERRSGRVSALSWGAIALFSGLLVIGATTEGGSLDTWGRFCAAAGLTLFAALSITGAPLVGHYTRELVPEDVLGTDEFRDANRAISQIWTLTMALVTVSYMVGAILLSPIAGTVFNWIVPALLLLKGSTEAARRWDLEFGEEPAGGWYPMLDA